MAGSVTVTGSEAEDRGQGSWGAGDFGWASWLPFERVIVYAFYLPSHLCDDDDDGIASLTYNSISVQTPSTVATKSARAAAH